MTRQVETRGQSFDSSQNNKLKSLLENDVSQPKAHMQKSHQGQKKLENSVNYLLVINDTMAGKSIRG